LVAEEEEEEEEEELGRGFVLGFEGVGKPEEELEWLGEETGMTMDHRQKAARLSLPR